MRSLFVSAAVSLFVFWVACSIELPGQEQPFSDPSRDVAADDWRRTVNGWERTSTWPSPKVQAKPRASYLHPALVASFQVLASCAGLLIFSETAKRPTHPSRG